MQDAALSLGKLYGAWSDPHAGSQDMTSTGQWTYANTLTSLPIVGIDFFKPEYAEDPKTLGFESLANFLGTALLQKQMTRGVGIGAELLVDGVILGGTKTVHYTVEGAHGLVRLSKAGGRGVARAATATADAAGAGFDALRNALP